MKTSISHWLPIKEVIHVLRMGYLRARLKLSDRIFQNLTFADIEKLYAGRAANHQLSAWRTLSVEAGEVYSYYDTVKGRQQQKIIGELPRKLFLANDAGVYSARGIVYNGYYNCVVLETLEAWGNDVNNSTDYIKITKKASREIEGLSVSLLSIGAVYNYAHFLFDSISRLPLLDKLPKKPDWFLVSGPPSAWKEKIVKHAGIAEKVIWINGEEEVLCEQLLFTNRINFSRHVSPFAAQAVRRIFLRENPVPGPRPFRVIFASRKNAKDRKTRVEDMIHQVLPSVVEIIDFETLSMEETIRICGECKVFFGIHGAGFANLVFANPGLSVIEFQIREILPEWHRNYYYTLYEQMNFIYRVEMVSEQIDEAALRELVGKIIKEA